MSQPVVVRLAHWLNVPLLAIMAMSGLQILVAFPYMGPRGAEYAWYPLQGWLAPEWLRLGSWLAGARAFHFAFAWFFVANALVYLVYLFASGEWRRRLFLARRDFPAAVATLLYYVRVRKRAPEQGLYNGLQRFAYTSALVLGALSVLSGLAIWKPVQLSPLASLFGGYDVARIVHLVSLFALALFALIHVILVSLHPRSVVEMVVGRTQDGTTHPQA